MGLFKSKQQKEKEKAQRECAEFVREYEKKQAELEPLKEQENRVLQEYAMLGKRLGEYLAEDRVLLCGSWARSYKVHLRGAQALEVDRSSVTDWDALLEKCDEFQPTILFLADCLKIEDLPKVRVFAGQVVQKHKNIVIVVLASEANEPGYIDTETEEPTILILPRFCGSEQFCGELTEFLKAREERR